MSNTSHTSKASADVTASPETTMSPAVLATLVASHARFRSFLERRVGRVEAEEILQDAFVRGMARGGELRDDEAAVAWFYRLLRNAIVDRSRHRAAEGRAMDAVAAELAADGDAHVDRELEATVCACVTELVPTLKTEYAEAVRRIDLGGASVPTFAAETGISVNNAGVRLHRARQALRRRVEEVCGTCTEHGCVDCTCAHPAG